MATSLKDYLKKYQSAGDEEKQPKKAKKKRKAAAAKAPLGLIIVDNDPAWQKSIDEDSDEPEVEGVDAPQVIEDVEVKRMHQMEKIKQHRPYMSIGDDGSGWITVDRNSKDAQRKVQTNASLRAGSPDASPPRREPTSQERGMSPPRKRNRTSDSPDASPPRRIPPSEDISPPRRRNRAAGSPDSSPPRRIPPSEDISPPRRRNRAAGSPDTSPPRRKPSSEGVSPPRRRNRAAGSPDASPPRRKPSSVYVSPPRRRNRAAASPDASPPQRKPSSDDISPPRRRHRTAGSPDSSPRRIPPSEDISPPRRRNRAAGSSDASPLRKPSSDDISPPRRRKRAARSPDASPPRRKPSSVDVSPPRRRKRAAGSPDASPLRRKPSSQDIPPPRRRKQTAGSPDSSPRRRMPPPQSKGTSGLDSMDSSPPRRKPVRMTDGRQAGLITNQAERAAELAKKKQEDARRLKEMGGGGRAAETVYRDKRGKRLEGLEELLRQQQGEAKPEVKPLEWGKGLAQKREVEERQAEFESEKAKPFARSRDDPELDKMYKERIRFGDPMAHLVKRKDPAAELVDLGASEEMKESGFIIPQDIPPHSWLKRGVGAPMNRYGIKPGRHWDGVDRSTGFESQMFKAKAEKQATEMEAYLWSVADM